MNDLTKFEKNILKVINFTNNKNYTHKNLMEWSSSKNVIQKNLRKGEIMYEISGIYVAIKE